MRFISWNVNGLRACLTKGFTDYFSAQQPDFMCLQETKMQPGQAEFPHEGYTVYMNSAEKKGYSGTLILARHEPLDVKMGLGIPEHDHEGRAITLKYPAFTLVTVYTPNSQRELTRLEYRQEWEAAFREYLMKLDRENPVIVCGDMCDHSKPHPEIYQKTICYLHADPAACVIVEDSEVGIQAGLAAGAEVLAYRGAGYGREGILRQDVSKAQMQLNSYEEAGEDFLERLLQ